MSETKFLRRRILAGALMVFVLALCWRCGWNIRATGYHFDETGFSLPGIEQLLHGHLLVYCYRSTYMAPIQEYLSVPLVKAFGLNLWTLRLPPIIFSSLAVALFFVASARLLSFWQALGLAVLLACPSSSATTYGLHSIPDYGVGLFLITVLLLATLAVDRSRSLLTWTGLGVLCGIAVYAFPVSEIQIGVGLLWLMWRSPYGQSIRASCARGLEGLAWLGTAAVPGTLLAYHYLTRRMTYHPGRMECVAMAVTAVPVAIGIYRLVRAFPPPRPACLAVACCLGLMIVVPMVPRVYFQQVAMPRLTPEQSNSLLKEPFYSLKMAHQWKENIAILGERVFPKLICGRFSVYMDPLQEVHFGIKSILIAAILALLAVPVAPIWKRHREDAAWKEDFTLYVMPLWITALVMAPSWNVYDDHSLRYLYPFWWAFWLLVWVGFFRADQKERLSVLQFAFLALYVSYSGWDCYHYLFRLPSAI